MDDIVTKLALSMDQKRSRFGDSFPALLECLEDHQHREANRNPSVQYSNLHVACAYVIDCIQFCQLLTDAGSAYRARGSILHQPCI